MLCTNNALHAFQLKCHYSALGVLLVLGAGVQPYTGPQQAGIGLAYPPGQSPFDTRVIHSPHGGRTPGRGTFRTPFFQDPQSRLSQTQSATVAQPAAELSSASEGAVSAGSTLDIAASPDTVNRLEALSLSDDLGGRRLNPIVTHPINSPSNVILASVSRGRTSEPASASLSQMSQAAEGQAVPRPTQLEHALGLPVTDPLVATHLSNEPISATEAATTYTSAGTG